MCFTKLVANRVIDFREGKLAMKVGKVPSECSNLFALAGGGEGETEDDSASDYEWNKDNQGGDEWADLDNSVTVVNSNGARVDSPGQGPSGGTNQGQTQMVQLQHVQQTALLWYWDHDWKMYLYYLLMILLLDHERNEVQNMYDDPQYLLLYSYCHAESCFW